jgi:hypothetical protein
MANINYKDELIAEIYREERMHEAKIVRLINRNGDQRSRHSNIIIEILKGLLKRMVSSGNRLRQGQISRKMT